MSAPTYQKREFTYAVLLNAPENAEEFTELGIDPANAFPNTAIVVNRELHVIEETFATVGDAEDRYEVVPTP